MVRFVPKSGKILTSRSSLSGTDRIYEFPKYSLVVVSIFEGEVPLQLFVSAIAKRVVAATDAQGKLLRPEFKQFVRRRFGFLFWHEEANFNIEDHVRIYDGKYKCQLQGQEVTPEILMLVANELAYKPFKKDSSPWEVLILHNYRESPDAPLSTASIIHIHHSLGKTI